jgi:hypothetical protein
MSNLQAIVRKSSTVAVTFAGIPDPELRKAMKAQRAEFKNGQWVRTQSESVVVDAADVSQHFAS